MSSSNSNLAPYVGFHQWVRQRIQSHNFDAHPRSAPDWSWTLESDIEGYINHLSQSGSQTELSEFLALRDRVRSTPNPPALPTILPSTGSERPAPRESRESRDRRFMYGDLEESSSWAYMINSLGEDAIGSIAHYRERLEMPDGIAAATISQESQDEVDELFQVLELTARENWIELTLNESDQERSRVLAELGARERELEARFMRRMHQIRIRRFQLENSGQEEEEEEAEEQGHTPEGTPIRQREERSEQDVRNIGRDMQRTNNGTPRPASDSSLERSHLSNEETSRQWDQAALDAEVERLSLSSDEDEDSHVRHRPDWHRPGDILGDIPVGRRRRQ